MAFFSDAIYAISLTLLVVALAVPTVSDATSSRDLWDALGDVSSEILMFFISFIVIGSFWLAHHRFVSKLGAVDRRLMFGTLCYLSFIAFLPFPSGLLGDFSDNSVAVALYALCIAAVASTEIVLFALARGHDLLLVRPTDEVFRWGVIAGLSPAALFLLSIPIAFISPTLGIISWALNIPVGMTIGRRMGTNANAYYNT